jgi:hypothetical protein
MSVFVTFDKWGRLGNRMFQYAFGYLLAQDKKTECFSSGLPNFDIPNNNIRLPKVLVWPTRFYGNNYVEYRELVDVVDVADILVNSFVQKARYYTSRREELRKVFKVSNNSPINKDSLVVHIRETDYKDIGVFLGYDYYKQAIKDAGFGKVILVTDNSKCDTIERLVADGCMLNSEGYVDKFDHVCDDRGMQDFYCILHSDNILISQSSFSWWAALLGNHSKIIFPFKQGGGMWKITPEKDDVDLYFSGSNNIQYIL